MSSLHHRSMKLHGGGLVKISIIAAIFNQTFMQPYYGTVQLGTPTITNSGDQAGLTYLETFVSLCAGCTCNFVNIHYPVDIRSNVQSGNILPFFPPACMVDSGNIDAVSIWFFGTLLAYLDRRGVNNAKCQALTTTRRGRLRLSWNSPHKQIYPTIARDSSSLHITGCILFNAHLPSPQLGIQKPAPSIIQWTSPTRSSCPF